MLFIVDGLAQIAGITLLVVGFGLPERWAVADGPWGRSTPRIR